MAFVHENPQVHDDRTIYSVSLTEVITIEVTVTNSMSAARRWLRQIEYFNNRHASYLQVGISSHGDRPDVISLSLEGMCLILRLPDEIYGSSHLARFLSNQIVHFVSTGPVPAEALFLHGYFNALTAGSWTFSEWAELVTAGNLLQLDPAVANGDWATWPLTEAQVLLCSIQSHVSFLIALLLV